MLSWKFSVPCILLILGAYIFFSFMVALGAEESERAQRRRVGFSGNLSYRVPPGAQGVIILSLLQLQRVDI